MPLLGYAFTHGCLCHAFASPDNLANLKKIAENFSQGKENAAVADADDSDDDIPDLLENFEDSELS